MRKCPNCDAEVTTYDRKCPLCKHVLSSEQEVTASAASTPRLRTSDFGFRLFALKFTQVFAILGIVGSFIMPVMLLINKQFCLLLLSPIWIILAFGWYYVVTAAIEYTEEK